MISCYLLTPKCMVVTALYKDELIKQGYPNKKPRMSYMAFDIAPIEKDLTFLVEHHLIERLIELDANNAKGTPVFIEP